MYLVDTNVLSEVRKGSRADPGVQRFFQGVVRQQADVFLSVVTIGELRRGIDLIRYRGDENQARRLDHWFSLVLDHYADYILELDSEIAQIWGRLRVPHPQNALDKQIAATALVHDLAVVTRNHKDFAHTGVRILNPFEPRR